MQQSPRIFSSRNRREVRETENWRERRVFKVSRALPKSIRDISFFSIPFAIVVAVVDPVVVVVVAVVDVAER